MAFFNTGKFSLAGQEKAAGYEPSMFLDASILSQLKEAGYILSPTSLNFKTVANQFQAIKKVVIGGKAVPAFQDSSGNVYIADEKQIIYLLEMSKVNPSTGLPNNTGGSGTQIDDGSGGGNAGSGNSGTGPGGNTSGGSIPTGGGFGSGKIYTRLDHDDIIPNQQEIVTYPLWSNNVGNLTTFFTGSAMTAAQKEYYYEVWNSGSQVDCTAAPQFSVAWGHYLGSGSLDQGGQIEDTPSRAIYSQYRLLCLDPSQERFIVNGSTTNSIYIVNVNRARMREFLDEGNVELNLAWLADTSSISGGAGEVTRLIDNSSTTSPTIMQSGEVYDMVSGSIEDGVYLTGSNEVVYGKLFKRKGIIVLDGNMLDASASFSTAVQREVNENNAERLFTSISGAAATYTDGSGDTLGFQGRGAEKVKSTHIFCRAKNAEYNFSNNPTFVSGGTGGSGDLVHPSMIGDPKVYITTVGLYSSNNDLVAVAKLSQPVQKSFTKEALIKVKLDF